MNILFFERSLDPSLGGIERVSRILGKYFEEHGHECYYAFGDKDYDLIDEKHKVKYDLTWEYPEFYSVLRTFVVENHIDIIINQDIYDKNIRLYRDLKKNNLCKIINCYHLSPDFFLRCRPRPTMLYRFLRFVYHTVSGISNPITEMYDVADKTVLLSRSFTSDFERIYRLPDTSKLYYISNPLSFDHFLSGEKIAQKKKEVLIVSRLEERPKNICAALRIWKLVEKKTEDWELVLAGYGDDEQKILNYAGELQLRHFKFIGKTDNPQPLYEKASLFMMTSLAEGFGMTLTEALQNACIPLAFDTFSALHDIVEDGVNGFIISACDEREYAGKLIYLTENEDVRTSMAQKAVLSIQKFAVENIGCQWLKLFASLC